jgi:cytochrome P450
MGASMETGSAPSLQEIDLTQRELFRGGFPHPTFATLREQAPVFWHEAASDPISTNGEGFWVLSRYDDIQPANRDSELFSALEGPNLRVYPEMTGNMLVAMDGREHTRLRKLISAGFTPRMVGRLEEQARTWAISIVENALERGTCDFVEDVAYQLPMHMIADIVGIPVEDRAWLFSIASDMLQATDPEHGISQAQRMGLQVEMFQYAQKLGQEKRKNPQDDVWTLLCKAEVETDEGERTTLTETELDLFFALLLLAGSETTRNAISLGLLALLDNPDQLERLREGRAAMPAAVEEILRWSSPVTYFARRATRDTEIRGVPIAAGDRITLWYPSGNRDDAVFEEPNRFDIARPSKPHLAFGGGGAHFCLGANLARREIAILFEELLARVGRIELKGEPTYSVQGIGSAVYVSIKSQPVHLEARR